MKKQFLISLIITIIFSTVARAEMRVHESAGNIYITQTTVAELENFFDKYDYRRFNILEDDAYPKIFVAKLPSDYNETQTQKDRNELFIRILAPIALKINKELANERNTLLRLDRKHLENKTLNTEEKKLLESLAQKYDYFTRSKDDARINDLIENLKWRINIIPPSILIAAAAMETNWGSSRIAQQANSLYKEKVWYTDEGLEPLENKDDGYRFKIFPDLTDSMRSFALTFNSNIKFRHVWYARDKAIKRHGLLVGESMAYTLSQASNLPNFVGILDYITAFYDLYFIDKGHLKDVTLE